MNEVIKGTNIYRLWLAKKKGGRFRFDRYRDVSQLGRYFTVTLNKSTTRLYSTVNFILDENLAFLRKYASVAYFVHNIEKSIFGRDQRTYQNSRQNRR